MWAGRNEGLNSNHGNTTRGNFNLGKIYLAEKDINKWAKDAITRSWTSEGRETRHEWDKSLQPMRDGWVELAIKEGALHWELQWIHQKSRQIKLDRFLHSKEKKSRTKWQTPPKMKLARLVYREKLVNHFFYSPFLYKIFTSAIRDCGATWRANGAKQNASV